MSKELVLPRVFDVVESAGRERDLAYFSTACPQVPESLTVGSAESTLIDFADSLSGPKLTDFMSNYRKEGRITDSSSFYLKPVFNQGSLTIGEIGSGQFYMDSNRSLALGFSDSDNDEVRWLAVVGIAIGNELDEYDKYREESPLGKGRMDFSYQFPVITQLQGPRKAAYFSKDYEIQKEAHRKATEILGSYKWERALIDIVLQWAQEQKAPAVYMLPANLNKWFDERREKQFKMRYDVSAERTGFRMQPNGLYGISLLPFPNLRT